MKTSNQLLLLVASTTLAAAPGFAQNIPVALNYNFNGIVHAAEANLPDDLNGYRSISDRGLDFSAGVPNDSLLNEYQLVGAAGALDIVHLGNRNTVDGGTKAFDATPNGDDIGVQPAWLAAPDQSGPQTTVMSPQLPIDTTTSIAFLYQISNGGGSFDVTFTFLSGSNTTATLSGGDWFGGTYAGTAFIDQAVVDNNLSITEGRVDMSAFVGETVTEITFENASNTNAGYAILACNFEYPLPPSRVNQIPLNYNFNGIVHATEASDPDNLLGYRSISDRGLDFTAGVPADPLLADYALVNAPMTLDIVHLGDRNLVDNSSKVFEATANGNNIGVQPNWLPSADQTGPQVTTLTDGIVMDSTSQASVLFQISNGGGTFDIEFQFATGAPVVATVSGPDWFGGSLPGTGDVDNGTPSANLSLTERTVSLFAQSGRTLTGVAFQNRSNANAGYAIVALNVVGCIDCANGAQANIQNLGGGTIGTLATTSTGNLGCDLNWAVSGTTPNALGLFAIGAGAPAPVPLSLVIPGCPGTIYTPNPVLVSAPTNASGSAQVSLPVPATQTLCGATLSGQYVELQLGACFLALSDAIAITIGN